MGAAEFFNFAISPSVLLHKAVRSCIAKGKLELLTKVQSIITNPLNRRGQADFDKYRKVPRKNALVVKILSEIGDEATTILKAAGFLILEDKIEFPTDGDFTKLQLAVNLVAAFIKDTLTPEELDQIIKKYMAIMAEGDKIKEARRTQPVTSSAQNFSSGMQIQQKYKEALQVLKNEGHIFNILRVHTLEQIADVQVNISQDLAGATKSYQEAIDLFSKAIPQSEIPAVSAQKTESVSNAVILIGAMAYYGLARCMSLYAVKDHDSMLRNVTRAWELVSPLLNVTNPDKLVVEEAKKISYFAYVIYTYLKRPQQQQQWLQQFETLGGNIEGAEDPKTPEEHLQSLGRRFLKIENEFTQNSGSPPPGINEKSKQDELIERLIVLVKEAEKPFPEFAASVCGQIIYHYRMEKNLSLHLQRSLEWAKHGIDLLVPMYNKYKHGVLRNIYLSLADVHERLGNKSEAEFYQKELKMAQNMLQNL